MSTTTVTQLLAEIDRGDPRAAHALLPLVYDELRRLAAARLAREPSAHTLQATALVHEAYLRLVGDDPADAAAPAWNGRGHFFAAAAEAMRRILVDAARRRQTLKHGRHATRVPLDPDALPSPDAPVPPDDLLALHGALDRLAAEDAVKARLVTLRYFAGLTLREAAQALQISDATADRHWAYARAWLHREISRAR